MCVIKSPAPSLMDNGMIVSNWLFHHEIYSFLAWVALTHTERINFAFYYLIICLNWSPPLKPLKGIAIPTTTTTTLHSQPTTSAHHPQSRTSKTYSNMCPDYSFPRRWHSNYRLQNTTGFVPYYPGCDSNLQQRQLSCRGTVYPGSRVQWHPIFCTADLLKSMQWSPCNLRYISGGLEVKCNTKCEDQCVGVSNT